jgi:hypothetical protein
MKNKTLKISCQHAQPIKLLNMEERGELLTALMDYQFEDKEPSDLSPRVEVAIEFVMPFVNMMNERYNASCENGKKGGRPQRESKSSIS